MKQLKKKKKKTKSRAVRKDNVENHAKKGDRNEGSTLKMSVEEAASADRDAEAGLDHDGGDDEFKQKKQVEEIGCDHDPNKDEAEEFLWSIVGDDPGLSLNVVTDVLIFKNIISSTGDMDCNLHWVLFQCVANRSVCDLKPSIRFAGLCGNDVEKALEVLLELSSSSEEQSDGGCYESSNREDAEYSHKNQNPEVVGLDLNADEFKQKNKPKLKKVVASAGTVSSKLGKDYVRSVPEKKGWPKLEGLQEQNWSKEQAEDFLWSVVGDDPGLSLNVVSDVLCLYEYDVEKALEVLLEFSISSEERSGGYYNKDDVDLQALQGKIWSAKKFFRNNSKKFESSGSQESTETGNLDLEDPQGVLESLFTMSAEQEPKKAELTNLFNKIASFSHQFTGQGQLIHGDEYPIVREAAHQHWNSMKSYDQNAVTAFKNGEKEYASYPSEQGRSERALAREADEKASWDILTARNQIIENTITVDLHGQHVRPAINILKIYLRLGACFPSMWSFRFITGHGKHAHGKSKVKEAVIDLLEQEGITWFEENKGALLVRLDGRRDFSFLHSGADLDP